MSFDQSIVAPELVDADPPEVFCACASCFAASPAAFVASATCSKAVWSMPGSTPDISTVFKVHLRPPVANCT